MTNRAYHIVAIALMIAGIALGGISWVLDGAPFWIVIAFAAALVVAGLYVAGRVSGGREEDGRKS